MSIAKKERWTCDRCGEVIEFLTSESSVTYRWGTVMARNVNGPVKIGEKREYRVPAIICPDCLGHLSDWWASLSPRKSRAKKNETA